MLIGFHADAGPRTPEARADVVRRNGGAIHRSLRLIPVVSATLPEPALRRMRARRDVAYVEEDIVLYACGQFLGWGVNRIDADRVWPAGNTGKGVKVAILDTGIDPAHPDIPVAGGVNFVGTTKDGSTNSADWQDRHGHGTHCAGIVAARNNALGVVGVAPDASVWAVKVLSDSGSGYTSDIIQGLDWCAAHGIQVVSMSLGGGGTTSLQAACDRTYAKGVVLVAAAGNNAGPVSYPAAYPSVIAVSATDARDVRAYFSNYGSAIELAAPGVSIYSTYKGGVYTTMSGTSMACPHVAGAAALAWASGLTSGSAVRTRLQSTAEDLGVKGTDTSYGYGLVDAEKACGGATAPTDTPPTLTLTAPASGATVSGTVAVTAAAGDDQGVVRVEFTVDGAGLGADTQGNDGWSVSWDTTRVADGSHTVAATATDTAGQTTSRSVPVTVRNAATPPPPAGTMSVGSITYTTSDTVPYYSDLLITARVLNAQGHPVWGAYLWANVYRNGQLYLTPFGVTNTAGSVTFKLTRAPAGLYKTTIARISATGLTWNGVTPPNEFCQVACDTPSAGERTRSGAVSTPSIHRGGSPGHGNPPRVFPGRNPDPSPSVTPCRLTVRHAGLSGRQSAHTNDRALRWPPDSRPLLSAKEARSLGTVPAHTPLCSPWHAGRSACHRRRDSANLFLHGQGRPSPRAWVPERASRGRSPGRQTIPARVGTGPAGRGGCRAGRRAFDGVVTTL